MTRKRVFFSVFSVIVLVYILLLTPGIALAVCVTATNCTEYCNNPCQGGVGYNPPSGSLCICPPTSATNVESVLANVTNYIFWIATAITPLLIIIGAFFFMTSGGEYEKITRAKHIITYTVIGYSIILLSRGLVYILADILGAP